MPAITLAEIEGKLSSEDLSEWLTLWHREQGPAKSAALKLMASAIPSPAGGMLKALDLCCGPGDAGRALFSRFPHAQIDFLDRDPFFLSLCDAVNRRDGVPGRTFLRDLIQPDWPRDLRNDYDVVTVANGLHWLTPALALNVFTDIHDLVRPGGCLIFMEPVGVEAPFEKGFAEWRAGQPEQHDPENWARFWSRVNALMGFDYLKQQLGEAPDPSRIGDTLPATGWLRLLSDAGFQRQDILLRDPEKIVLAALKPR